MSCCCFCSYFVVVFIWLLYLVIGVLSCFCVVCDGALFFIMFCFVSLIFIYSDVLLLMYLVVWGCVLLFLLFRSHCGDLLLLCVLVNVSVFCFIYYSFHYLGLLVYLFLRFLFMLQFVLICLYDSATSEVNAPAVNDAYPISIHDPLPDYRHLSYAVFFLLCLVGVQRDSS